MKRVLLAASLTLALTWLGGGVPGTGVGAAHAAEVPLNGTYSGVLTATSVPGGFSYPQSFQGSGHAARLGDNSLTGDRDGFDLCGSILHPGMFRNDNFFVLSKSSTDSITLEYHISSCDPAEAGTFAVEAGTFTVAGGTGRFAGAEGSGVYSLSSTLVGSSTDPQTELTTYTYSFQLSLTGSLRVGPTD